jgi:hypothetical protein
MAALGTRALVLTIATVDYTAQVAKAVISSEASDSDFVSFADAASGGSRTYKLNLVFTQDLASTGLWNTVWSAAGTDVAFLLKPYGNAAASAAQPHYSGTVTITEPDGDLVGGEANASTSARFTTEVAWTCTGKPVKVVA